MDEKRNDTNSINEDSISKDSLDKDSTPKVSNPKDSGHKDAKPRKDKKTSKDLSAKWKDLRGEFNKIIWPSKKELAKQTTTVIVTSAIVGGVIVVLDAVFAVGVTTFSSLLSR